MDAAATIAADGWKVLKPELDQVPVFVCANAAGQPLRYERDGRPLALFYADVSQAKQELADCRRSYPELELRLLPIGLGSAFTRAGAGAAVIVPSPEELDNAADPEAGAPYEAGLPLFMRAADAQASRDAAAAGMPRDTQGLELLVIPLPTALERMVAQPGDDGLVFEIIPPGDSVDFVRQFLAAPTPAQAASVFPDMNIFPS